MHVVEIRRGEHPLGRFCDARATFGAACRDVRAVLRGDGRATLLVLTAACVLFDREPGISHGDTTSWTATRPTTADDSVSVVFHLRHDPSTLAELEKFFWAVSEPASLTYGEHMSQQQIAQRFGPVDGAAATVTDWLRESGVDTFSVAATGDMIDATMSAPIAERLFETEIHSFQHATTGHSLNRAVRSYSLPATVAAAVAVVGDLVALPAVNTGIRVDEPAVSEPNADWPTDCENGGLFKKCGSAFQKFVTPEVLNQRYNLGELPVVARGSMAVAEFQV